ncbi:MAG: hypothetical protein WCG84_03660 [Candidatus Moraniibacteriota bacterium]
MDKKTRILLIVSIVVGTLSFGVTFWKAFIGRSYTVSFHVVCDPSREACFAQTCTPENPENNLCRNPIALFEYYKILQMKAFAVPTCDKNNGNCSLLSCTSQPKSAACMEVLCNRVIEMPEGVTCNNPATYQLPLVQESVPKIETPSE